MALRMRLLPRLSSARARSHLRARRLGVRALMYASQMPLIRLGAERGMRTMFDSMADNWERIRSGVEYRIGFAQALAELPPSFTPQHALDVACGSGLASRLLLERWPELTLNGVDISPRMVEQAKQRTPSAKFTVGSAHELPFTDQQFDLVTVLDGIVDVPELLRVVKKRGYVLIVYSSGGTTPISRPLSILASKFESQGANTRIIEDGISHVLRAQRTN